MIHTSLALPKCAPCFKGLPFKEGCRFLHEHISHLFMFKPGSALLGTPLSKITSFCFGVSIRVRDFKNY